MSAPTSLFPRSLTSICPAMILWAACGTVGTILMCAVIDWGVVISAAIPAGWWLPFWNGLYVGGAWACLGFLDHDDYHPDTPVPIKALGQAFAVGFTLTILFTGLVQVLGWHGMHSLPITLVLVVIGIPLGVWIAKRLHMHSRKRRTLTQQPPHQPSEIEAVLVYASEKLPQHYQ